jgi:hypothetical protein
MDILLCIDDTDNLESVGTGELAENMAEGIRSGFGGICSAITRHQLYVHEDIPYTSHNSSMCFRAAIADDRLEPVIRYGIEFLERESASGSDPGLCVAPLHGIGNPEELICFGRTAKQEVMTKDVAYDLARRQRVHLSEHGGTGQGIIGALAGIGLRLSGNDGRFKGWFHFEGRERIMEARKLYDSPFVDEVRTAAGLRIDPEEPVFVGNEVKTVFQDGQAVVLVDEQAEKPGVRWRTLSKRELKVY